MKNQALVWKYGFTLIEMIIVVGIIGSLLSLGVISYLGANKNALDTKRKADMEKIRLSLQDYYSENEVYPNSLNLITPLPPKDPETSLDYFYECIDANCSDYILGAKLFKNSTPSTTPVCDFSTFVYNNYCVSKDGSKSQ